MTLFTIMVASLVLHAQPTLKQKIDVVLPKAAEERWLTIPWRTNVMEARTEAQRSGKPLFLWIMNGNPLGCT